MNESLENNLGFDKVSFAQIGELINLASSTQKRDIAYLKERYARSALSFEETLAFLQAIGIIEEMGGELHAKAEYVGLNESELKKRILQTLFKSSRRVLSDFYEYLENFIEADGKYSFRPSLGTNLSTSGLRNLLIQLGFMEHERASGMYVATELGASFLTARQRKLTAQGLTAILRSQERLGAAAEEAVIAYEREALASFPELAALIRHTAQEDVGAGYDIYSVRSNQQGGYDERYIEVKAVSKDRDFYWSLNELNTAKAYGPKYYLYLVSVIGAGMFDIPNVIVIPDPYHDLFENEDARILQSVTFHIQPKSTYLRSKPEHLS